MVGIISQFVPTTMVDIRPLSVSLPELSFIKGDITKLPFKDCEISSLSSICVIEHIGLGRYGDPLDQFGTEKSAKELSRVLAKNGNLYISVPIDSKNKTYFNAHRAFTRDYVLSLFKGLLLIEEKYIYGNDMVNSYDVSKGFGTGLYYFKK
jgi:ubiquinone/menaquinone biosynthesis C-methylase UbiE